MLVHGIPMLLKPESYTAAVKHHAQHKLYPLALQSFGQSCYVAVSVLTKSIVDLMITLHYLVTVGAWQDCGERSVPGCARSL